MPSLNTRLGGFRRSDLFARRDGLATLGAFVACIAAKVIAAFGTKSLLGSSPAPEYCGCINRRKDQARNQQKPIRASYTTKQIIARIWHSFLTLIVNPKSNTYCIQPPSFPSVIAWIPAWIIRLLRLRSVSPRSHAYSRYRTLLFLFGEFIPIFSFLKSKTNSTITSLHRAYQIVAVIWEHAQSAKPTSI